MESLFLELQIDRQFKRKAALLMHLNDMPDNTSSKRDILIKLHITPPTLLADISVLNKELNDYLHIFSPREGEYQLFLRTGTSLSTVLAQLTKQTVPFQIVNSIFHERKWTFQQALTNLNISRATLTRIIRHMNAVLKRFHVSISSRILRFSGKEEDIRCCLFAFFVNFNSNTIISENVLKDAGKWFDSIQKSNLAYLRYNHYRITLWIAIAQIRWKCKQFVTLNDEIKKIIIRNDEFDYFTRSLRFLFENFSLTSAPLDDEVLWAYITSLHAVSYSTSDSAGENYQHHLFHRYDIPEVFEEIQQFIYRMMPHIRPGDDAYIKIESFLVNTRILSRLSPIYEMTQPTIIQNMKNNHPDVFKKFHQQLKTFSKHGKHLKFHYLEDIAACLTILYITAIKKARSNRSLNILFAFQGPAGYDEYLMATSKQYFAPQINIQYLFDGEMFDQIDETVKTDLIISNYDLCPPKSMTCPHVRMTNIPTPLDWKVVQEALNRLADE